MAKQEWTDYELTTLKELYTKNGVIFEEVCAELPNRSPNSIRCKASRLGYKRPEYFALTGGEVTV